MPAGSAAAASGGLALDVFGLTDVGCKRARNEDAFACDRQQGLFVVADGIGGKQGGETAAQAVTSHIRQALQKSR